MKTGSRRVAAFALSFALIATGCLADTAEIATITAEDLHTRLTANEAKPLVVDVREPAEFEEIHIDGALLAPLASVAKHLENVDKHREIVLVCRSGRRSAQAYRTLTTLGFTSMKNMEGGMLAWEKAGYPVVKK